MINSIKIKRIVNDEKEFSEQSTAFEIQKITLQTENTKKREEGNDDVYAEKTQKQILAVLATGLLGSGGAFWGMGMEPVQAVAL